MSKARREKLAKIRADAIKLDGEVRPLIKDPPPPGAVQKASRRLQSTLGLVVELADVLESVIADLEKSG